VVLRDGLARPPTSRATDRSDWVSRVLSENRRRAGRYAVQMPFGSQPFASARLAFTVIPLAFVFRTRISSSHSNPAGGNAALPAIVTDPCYCARTINA
jgi:hypothetical protein